MSKTNKKEHFLYRGFSTSCLARDIVRPLEPVSHWGSLRMAEYFAYQALDDRPGEYPVIVAVPISAFDTDALAPDLEMVRDPVFEEDVEASGLDQIWAESDKSWQACLACYDAVIYRKPVTILPGHILTGRERLFMQAASLAVQQVA